MSSVFLVVKPSKIMSYPLYKILYTKKRIESYSIMRTIIPPNKILLMWGRKLQRFLSCIGEGLIWDVLAGA